MTTREVQKDSEDPWEGQYRPEDTFLIDKQSPGIDESLLDFEQYVEYKEKPKNKSTKKNYPDSASRVLKLYKIRSSVNSSVIDSPVRKRTFKSPKKHEGSSNKSLELEKKDSLTPLVPLRLKKSPTKK